MRVCRDKCDSVIYVVLDGGVAAAAPEQKRELVKRVGRFSSLLALLKKKIVQTTREKKENKNGSLLLLSQSPLPRRHLLHGDGAAQALPLFLMMGLKPAKIDVVFAYHSPDEVLSFEQQLGQFYLNIDVTGTPIFIPSVRTTHNELDGS